MAEVRSLWVSLKARSSAFVSGIGKAKKALGGFVDSIPGANLLLSKFGAIASGAAVVGFVAWTKAAGNAMDATVKFSDSVGMSIERFQALAYAGDLAGVSSEQVQMALRTMTRGLDDAARGTGTAKEALDRLGLSAQTLKRLSPDDQIAALADALAGVEDPASKAALAMDLFGAKNIGIVNLLGSGSKAIKDAEDELRRLGLTLNRVDVMKVEMANDAFTRLGYVIKGIGERFAIELAPAMKAAADGAVDWMEAQGGAASIVHEAITGVIDVVAVLIRAWKYMENGAKMVGAVISRVFSGLLEFMAPMLKVLETAVQGFLDLARKIPGLSGILPEKVTFGADVEKWAKSLGERSAVWMTDAANGLADATFTQWDQELKDRIAASRAAMDAQARALLEKQKANGSGTSVSGGGSFTERRGAFGTIRDFDWGTRKAGMPEGSDNAILGPLLKQARDQATRDEQKKQTTALEKIATGVASLSGIPAVMVP